MEGKRYFLFKGRWLLLLRARGCCCSRVRSGRYSFIDGKILLCGEEEVDRKSQGSYSAESNLSVKGEISGTLSLTRFSTSLMRLARLASK